MVPKLKIFLIVFLLGIGCASSATHNRSQDAPGTAEGDSSAEEGFAQTIWEDFRNRTSFLEDSIVCIQPSQGGMDESVETEAKSQFFKRELERRGIHNYESFSYGSPPLSMIRVEGSQVYEYSIDLKPIGVRNGMQCYKCVVSLVPSQRDFDTEKARMYTLTGFPGDLLTPKPADCRGDSGLCSWVSTSLAPHAAELKTILSDRTINIVENFQQGISLMTPSVVVRLSRDALVPRDAVSGVRFFLASGDVYHLPPCRYSGDTKGMSSKIYFLPSKGQLAMESEVNSAFSAGDGVFWPTFDVSTLPSEYPSGDLLIVREYSVLSSPLSFSKEKKQLANMFTQMDASSVVLEGVTSSECYTETLRYRSGSGILVVIGRDRRDAFVWREKEEVSPAPAPESNFFVDGIQPSLEGHVNDAVIEVRSKEGKDEVWIRREGETQKLVVRRGVLWMRATTDKGGSVQYGASGELIVGSDSEVLLAMGDDVGRGEWFKGTIDYDGSKYVLVGTVPILDYIFESSEEDPLIFQLRRGKGFMYLSGKGEVLNRSATIIKSFK